jgi:hypothetical protein
MPVRGRDRDSVVPRKGIEILIRVNFDALAQDREDKESSLFEYVFRG